MTNKDDKELQGLVDRIQNNLTLAEGVAALKARDVAKEREIEQRFVKEFKTKAIPETTEYANGWNDCRKWVRSELNYMSGITERPKSDLVRSKEQPSE